MRALFVVIPFLGIPLAACGLTSSFPTASGPAVSDPEPPGRPRPRAPGPARAVAPLVASSCAQRVVKHGDSGGDAAGVAAEGADQDAERRRAVAFRNRCSFPIRVLHAVRSNGQLTEFTDVLGVGETSKFTGIENGFDRPGYVVCRYDAVPASAACRVGRGE